MNQVKEKINFDLIIRASKSLNPKELMELLQYNISKFYSWGAKRC